MYGLPEAAATAFLGISKIPVGGFEIHSLFLLFVQIFLFSSDTNLCPGMSDLG